jgi:hypothetical protein
MSTFSKTIHNVESLLAGQSTFSEVMADEGAMIQANIADLPPALQGATNLMYEAFKAGVSSLVGFGQTALGPILSESSDDQATQIANLLSLMGVKTVGPFTAAEHAALVAAINYLKTGLDRIGLKITTSGVHTASAQNSVTTGKVGTVTGVATTVVNAPQ